MDNIEQHFEEAKNLIQSAKRILLVSHRRPDGDTLGASIGLFLGLSQLGKNCTLACIDEIPRRLGFLTKLLPPSVSFVREFDMYQFDLIIISDAGAYHMTGFHEKYPEFLSKKVPILNIDHHASNERFGTVNIIDPKASSATMLIWKFSKKFPITLTREIGLALLTGIYNDTGGFIHSNTTKETFEVASELVKSGALVSEIVQPLFKQSTFAQLRLWGYILEHMRKNDREIFFSVITESDFKTIGAHASDTGGIIDLMNTIPASAYTMLLAEDEGMVKGSLRTQRDDIDLSQIAGQFGGGGHRKASGFRVPGRLKKEVVWRIMPTTNVSPSSLVFPTPLQA